MIVILFHFPYITHYEFWDNSCWFCCRSITGPPYPRGNLPLLRRYGPLLALIFFLAFIFFILLLWLNRGDEDYDPLFDPLKNPHIRIEKWEGSRHTLLISLCFWPCFCIWKSLMDEVALVWLWYSHRGSSPPPMTYFETFCSWKHSTFHAFDLNCGAKIHILRTADLGIFVRHNPQFLLSCLNVARDQP